MSTREWQPGDVAVVWINDRRELALVRPRREAANEGLEFAYVNGGFDMTDDLAPGWNARPLVVINPEDREQVARLTGLVKSHRLGLAVDEGTVAGALREFANPTPPKPEEPTGLGAVVEDSNGDKWVRLAPSIADFDWLHADDPSRSRAWRNIAAVKVLSEGVTG